MGESLEDKFRDGLEGVIEMAERLTPFCKTLEEVIGIAKLALENEGQLKLLMRSTGVKTK